MIDVRDASSAGWTLFCPDCEKATGVKIQSVYEIGKHSYPKSVKFIRRHYKCGESDLLNEIIKRIESPVCD